MVMQRVKKATLLDQLRSNGTKTYDATVKIYGVGADGKADTSKVVATKTD